MMSSELANKMLALNAIALVVAVASLQAQDVRATAADNAWAGQLPLEDPAKVYTENVWAMLPQPLYAEREQIYQKIAANQLDAAVRQANELVHRMARHPNKPELLLYRQTIFMLKIKAEAMNRQYLDALLDGVRFSSFCASLPPSTPCPNTQPVENLIKHLEESLKGLDDKVEILGLSPAELEDEARIKQAKKRHLEMLAPRRHAFMNEGHRKYVALIYDWVERTYKTLLEHVQQNRDFYRSQNGFQAQREPRPAPSPEPQPQPQPKPARKPSFKKDPFKPHRKAFKKDPSSDDESEEVCPEINADSALPTARPSRPYSFVPSQSPTVAPFYQPRPSPAPFTPPRPSPPPNRPYSRPRPSFRPYTPPRPSPRPYTPPRPSPTPFQRPRPSKGPYVAPTPAPRPPPGQATPRSSKPISMENIDASLMAMRQTGEAQLAADQLEESIGTSKELLDRLEGGATDREDLVAFKQSVYELKIKAEVKSRQYLEALLDTAKCLSFCEGVADGCPQEEVMRRMQTQIEASLEATSKMELLGLTTDDLASRAKLKKGQIRIQKLLHPDRNMDLNEGQRRYVGGLFDRANNAFKELLNVD